MTEKIKAGVIGYPIQQSLSPIIHQYWYDRAGLDGSYEKFKISPDENVFEDHLRKLLMAGYSGVNVTIPFKARAFAIADTSSPEAKFLGVANTLSFVDGKIHAENTDKIGFQTSLLSALKSHNIDPECFEKLLVIGAGGATPAILLALKDIGITSCDLANRTIDKASKIKDRFEGVLNINPISLDEARTKIDQYDLVVNTSSLGMKGQSKLEMQFTKNAKTKFVADIVFVPVATALLQSADQHNIPNMNGLSMLIHQARPGHQTWFGSDTTVTPTIMYKCVAALSAK